MSHQILPTTCERIETDCPSVSGSLRRNDHPTGPSAVSTGLGGARQLSTACSTGLAFREPRMPRNLSAVAFGCMVGPACTASVPSQSYLHLMLWGREPLGELSLSPPKASLSGFRSQVLSCHLVGTFHPLPIVWDGFLWTPGTSPLPLLGACVFLNPGNFAPPGNLRLVSSWIPGTLPLPLLGACVVLNPGNFAPPGNLRLRLSACGSLWTPGTSPLPLLEACRSCTFTGRRTG